MVLGAKPCLKFVTLAVLLIKKQRIKDWLHFKFANVNSPASIVKARM